MECAISPALFVMTIQVILNAAEQRITEAYNEGSVYAPPINAFMDNTILITNRKQKAGDAKNQRKGKRPARVVQNGAQAREVQKPRPNKRQSENVFFFVVGQRIPTVSEEHVKSLGRVFDTDLSDTKQEAAVKEQCQEGMEAIRSQENSRCDYRSSCCFQDSCGFSPFMR